MEELLDNIIKLFEEDKDQPEFILRADLEMLIKLAMDKKEEQDSEEIINEIRDYDEGYDDGYDEGYNDGHAAGWRAARAAIDEIFE